MPDINIGSNQAEFINKTAASLLYNRARRWQHHTPTQSCLFNKKHGGSSIMPCGCSSVAGSENLNWTHQQILSKVWEYLCICDVCAFDFQTISLLHADIVWCCVLEQCRSIKDGNSIVLQILSRCAVFSMLT